MGGQPFDSVAASLRDAKYGLEMGDASVGVVHAMNHGKSWPAATSGSRPLFGEDVVDLLHDPFCPLNRGGDHGGGSRTLPGVEEIIGGSQVTSHEDSGDDGQDSSSCRVIVIEGRVRLG